MSITSTAGGTLSGRRAVTSAVPTASRPPCSSSISTASSRSTKPSAFVRQLGVAHGRAAPGPQSRARGHARPPRRRSIRRHIMLAESAEPAPRDGHSDPRESGDADQPRRARGLLRCLDRHRSVRARAAPEGERIVKDAEIAMVDAKKAGGNRAEYFTPDDAHAALRSRFARGRFTPRARSQRDQGVLPADRAPRGSHRRRVRGDVALAASASRASSPPPISCRSPRRAGLIVDLGVFAMEQHRARARRLAESAGGRAADLRQHRTFPRANCCVTICWPT